MISKVRSDEKQGDFHCLDSRSLVSLVEILLGDPFCDDLTYNTLFQVLAKHNFLEV